MRCTIFHNQSWKAVLLVGCLLQHPLLVLKLHAAEDLFAAARQARVMLEKSDAEYLSGIQDLFLVLDQAIANIPQSPTESDFTYERRALNLMKEICMQIVVQCDEMLAAFEKYHTINHKYENDLKTAAPQFAAAAATFREYAKAERYPDHRQDYLTLAQIFTSISKRCQSRPSELRTQIIAVDEVIPYMRQGRQVVVRFHDALDAIPVLASGEEFDQLHMKLVAYVKSYERFRSSIKALRDKLAPEESFETDPSGSESNEPFADDDPFTYSDHGRIVPLASPVVQRSEPIAIPAVYQTQRIVSSLIASEYNRELNTRNRVPSSARTPRERPKPSRKDVFSFRLPNFEGTKWYSVDNQLVREGTVIAIPETKGFRAVKIVSHHADYPDTNERWWESQLTHELPDISIHAVSLVR
jgi:hypothetical protein